MKNTEMDNVIHVFRFCSGRSKKIFHICLVYGLSLVWYVSKENFVCQ